MPVERGMEVNHRRIVDIHSHTLPGMDDGSKSMEETMEMLRIASDNEITDMIVTPHFKKGRKNAPPAVILERVRKVEQEARRQGIPISLYPGNEIYYYSDVEDILEAGQICTLNHSEYVLVEFAPSESFVYIRNALDSLNGMGYSPILAHVERYECMLKDWQNVEQLRALNVEIQVNASSVTGKVGYKVKKFVHRLLGNQLVDYISTDAHDSEKRTPDVQKCLEYLHKKYDSAYVDAITYGNAQKILN